MPYVNTIPMSISVTPESKARLKEWAKDNDTTVSGAITQWIWAQELKSEAAAKGADNDD